MRVYGAKCDANALFDGKYYKDSSGVAFAMGANSPCDVTCHFDFLLYKRNLAYIKYVPGSNWHAPFPPCPVFGAAPFSELRPTE